MKDLNEEDAAAILGIPVTASPRQVELAFRDMSFLVHPDRHENDPDTQAAMAHEFIKVVKAKSLMKVRARKNATTQETVPCCTSSSRSVGGCVSSEESSDVPVGEATDSAHHHGTADVWAKKINAMAVADESTPERSGHSGWSHTFSITPEDPLVPAVTPPDSNSDKPAIQIPTTLRREHPEWTSTSCVSPTDENPIRFQNSIRPPRCGDTSCSPTTATTTAAMSEDGMSPISSSGTNASPLFRSASATTRNAESPRAYSTQTPSSAMQLHVNSSFRLKDVPFAQYDRDSYARAHW